MSFPTCQRFLLRINYPQILIDSPEDKSSAPHQTDSPILQQPSLISSLIHTRATCLCFRLRLALCSSFALSSPSFLFLSALFPPSLFSFIHLKTRFKYSEIHFDQKSETISQVYQRRWIIFPFFITFTDNAMSFTMKYTYHLNAKQHLPKLLKKIKESTL